MLSQLLKQWGDEGLEAHVRKTQLEYWRRASAMHKAATKVGSSQVDRPGINHPLFGDFGHTLFAGLSHALLVGINSTSN